MTAMRARRHAAMVGVGVVLLAALSACGSSSSTPAPQGFAHCDAAVDCTSVVSLGDVSMKVDATASKASQTVSAELVTDQPLHCPTGSRGTTGIFSSTATDASKTVTLSIGGSEGVSISAGHKAHPDHLGCYGAPQPFSGYVSPRSSRAVYVKADGLYEAALLACTSADAKPCFRYSESGGIVELTIEAPAGDPHVTGGP